MNARYWLAALTLTILAACGGGTPANTFKAVLNGSNERPTPVNTTATGTATVTLNETAKTITVDGSYSSTLTVTVAHIHGPAGKEGTASPVCALAVDNAQYKISAGACNRVLTDQEIADLRNGQWYVNLHSAANTGGEIRGQLEKQ